MNRALPLSKRGRWLLAAALVGAVAILGLGLRLFWEPAQAGPIDVQLIDIASIQLQPVPEGPTLLWNNPPSSPYSELRSQIEAAIPNPLPAPEFQPPGCTGGDLIVHLRDGRDITYGPCRHPASIRALWSRLIKVLSDPSCREPCGPAQ